MNPVKRSVTGGVTENVEAFMKLNITCEVFLYR